MSINQFDTFGDRDMDEQANLREQQSVAAEILRIWDDIPEGGEVTSNQSSEIMENAYRLAELVQSLHEYRFNRNPPIP